MKCFSIEKFQNAMSIPTIFLNQNMSSSCPLNLKIPHLQVRWVYIETSAKNNTNVNEAFEKLTEKALEKSLSPEEKETLKKEETLRKELINQLQKYTDRIDTYKDKYDKMMPNFKQGFKIFANSRGLNREANYYLAKSLSKALKDPNTEISEIFEKLTDKRNTIIGEEKLFSKPDFKNRGINSKELNKIIEYAKEQTEKENKGPSGPSH